jgi:hypothetical protein
MLKYVNRDSRKEAAMYRINSTGAINDMVLNIVQLIKKGFTGLVTLFQNSNLTSGDLAYKKRFVRKYLPDLYYRHTIEHFANCAFCSWLVKSSCHKYCMKCTKGTYIESSPLLPGILCCDEKGLPGRSNVSKPWYFRNACPNFQRLPINNYFRNFNVFLSPITVYNYEILEGLMEGITSSEKPCFVCASTDYGIYKRCSMQGDFDKNTPCSRIYMEIAARYL